MLAAFCGFILGGAVMTATLGLFNPVNASHFAAGAAEWLKGIPDGFYELISLLGVGYIAARSADKFTQARHGKVDNQDEPQ